ncbi:hypothetical protein TcWFU_003880 [Taenia crassiceps]|uniref:Uncharacterized protein n=1 Tax=Taenia crassiceps TaxID=6207 RepID=A0ABR4Q0L0_9CEST
MAVAQALPLATRSATSRLSPGRINLLHSDLLSYPVNDADLCSTKLADSLTISGILFDRRRGNSGIAYAFILASNRYNFEIEDEGNR